MDQKGCDDVGYNYYYIYILHSLLAIERLGQGNWRPKIWRPVSSQAQTKAAADLVMSG